MTTDDDAMAVERVKAGDIESFGGIVRRNERRVTSFGRRFFRNLADVEDFVQDVFLQAFRKLETFRGESRFSSWLLSIAYHIAVRQKQRRADYEVIVEEIEDQREPDPEQRAIIRETTRAIVDAMRSLPERFATCLDLFFFFGQTYQEISETTGHPINTVRSHIRRAKQLMRDMLEPGFPEECYGLS